MKRPIRIEGNAAYVPLTKGYEAVIDAADVPLVEGFNWCATVARKADGSVRTVYAVRNAKGRPVLMHAVLHPVPGGETDHQDGNGLNNRRVNLRSATKSQNQCNMRTPVDNRSGFKGVHWCETHQRWVARLRLHKRLMFSKTFKDKNEAAAAYAQASLKFHGEYGRTG